MILPPAAAKAGAGSRKIDRADRCAKDVGSLRCLKGPFFGQDGLQDKELHKTLSGQKRVAMCASTAIKTKQNKKHNTTERCAKNVGSLRCLKGPFFGQDRLQGKELRKTLSGQKRVAMCASTAIKTKQNKKQNTTEQQLTP